MLEVATTTGGTSRATAAWWTVASPLLRSEDDSIQNIQSLRSLETALEHNKTGPLR